MILQPCPLCGSTITSRKITAIPQYFNRHNLTVMDKEYVVCEICGCTAPKDKWQNRNKKDQK